MSARGRKSSNNGDTQQHESFVFGDHGAVIVEHGKKWAAYDKNGRLLILGYNRRIIQEYADAKAKIRSE